LEAFHARQESDQKDYQTPLDYSHEERKQEKIAAL
jgi:hypothetical protein